MPSRAHVCACAVACALALPLEVTAQERSPRELIDVIVRDGPRAVAIRAETDVVRREQFARLAFPNPAAAYTREGAGFTEFLQVEQLLPVFGIRAALMRAGVAATAAAEADRNARLWELRAEAAQTVESLVWAEARAEATANDVAAVSRLVDVLRIREREGEGARFDRLRAEQELADMRQISVTASVGVVQARRGVEALLPPEYGVARVLAEPSRSALALDRSSLMARARAARAELRALQLATERTSREADVARLARRPAPIVSGGMKRADTSGRRAVGSVVGLSVAVPVFDTGAREAARWIADGARLSAQRTAMERQIQAEVEGAIEALRLRRTAFESVLDDERGAELVTTADVAYREGEISIVVLLDAVRTAARARMRDIERRLDLRLAEIALERAVGEALWP